MMMRTLDVCKCSVLLLYLLPSFFIMRSRGQSEDREYCQFETMAATCQKDEVIIMRNASYGRMELGRCVTSDLGFVGCQNNVLHLADMRCSGRQTCEISIPDKEFDATKPCLEELKFYLKASYRCQKVYSVNRASCAVCNHGVHVRQPSGMIASTVTKEKGCGSPDCPWIIEVPSGQLINITLTDFALEHQRQASDNFLSDMANCRVYATIQEVGQPAKSICGGKARVKQVYYSKSNMVKIRVVGQDVETSPFFLLSYQAFGCANPATPPGGWVKRINDRVLVGCNYTGESWEMLCRNDVWHGKTGNCTLGGLFPRSVIGGVVFPSGLSILIILAVAVAIGIVIFGVGLVYLRRRRQCNSTARRSNMPLPPPPPSGIPGKHMYAPESIDNLHNDDKHAFDPRCERNEYAHIWEMPLPQPKSSASLPAETDRLSLSPYGYHPSARGSTYNTAPPRVGPGLCPGYHRECDPYESDGIADPRYFQLDPNESIGEQL